jgi:SH3-like domain-containing protein
MRTRTAPPTTDGLRWALVLLALFGAAVLPSREADARTRRFVRVKVDVANLRARPSSTAEQIRAAYENEPLQVVGRQGRWLEVRDVAGEAAWIYAALTDGRPAVVVVRDVVNVRERPGTAHPIAFTAQQGVNLLVLERAGRWLHVRHDVGEGWVHDSLVWGSP